MVQNDPGLYFPHPAYYCTEDGLLAIGGDLSPQRLLLAYHFGIFPWYSEGYEILWWSPDPRCVLFPENLKISKSMRNLIRKKAFTVTADLEFEKVITCCQKTNRPGQEGTWITEDMIKAYCYLHHMGIAHSIEVWEEDQMVGGLYGLSLGKVFFGESMFSHASNASKYGFIALVQKLRSLKYAVIDCQQDTPHLKSLGAQLTPRTEFMQMLKINRLRAENPGPWSSWQFTPVIRDPSTD